MMEMTPIEAILYRDDGDLYINLSKVECRDQDEIINNTVTDLEVPKCNQKIFFNALFYHMSDYILKDMEEWLKDNEDFKNYKYTTIGGYKYILKTNNQPCTYMDYLIDYVYIFYNNRNLRNVLNPKQCKFYLNLIRVVGDTSLFYKKLKPERDHLFNIIEYFEPFEAMFMRDIIAYFIEIQPLHNNDMVEMLKDIIKKFENVEIQDYVKKVLI